MYVRSIDQIERETKKRGTDGRTGIGKRQRTKRKSSFDLFADFLALIGGSLGQSNDDQGTFQSQLHLLSRVRLGIPRLFSIMLRLLGPRSSNHLLVQLTRAVSNQTKTAPSSSQPSNTRRFPRTPPRQVDLQKLFSDEPTASVSTPADPPARRPVVNPSATQARYEEDIADVDDYRGEEKRRLTARQTKNRKFSEPKTVQTNFDGLELIESKFDEKNAEQRRRLSNQQEAKTNQPRQPRRERSLTDQVRASETEDAGRTASTGMLTNTIKETKTIDELLNIFDSYIIPNEFALGLQKLCQMASAENSDTVHLYQQGDKRRQRMETLLLNFVSCSVVGRE